HGTPVAWPVTGPRADLPTYPFQQRSYWLNAPRDTDAAPGQTATGHPLLGAAIDLAGASGRWYGGSLAADRPWYLAQHQLLGTPVMPATAMLEWALAATRETAAADPDTAWQLEQVTFNEFLPMPDGDPVRAQAVAEPTGDAHRIRCFSHSGDPRTGQWTEHVTVASATAAKAADPGRVSIEDRASRLTEVPTDTLYERLWRAGVEYGPAFRGLTRLLREGDEALAHVSVATRATDAYTLHPVVLDACLHIVSAFVGTDDRLWLPAAIDRVAVFGRVPDRVWCSARWHGELPSGASALDLEVRSEDGELLVSLEGLQFRAVPRSALVQLVAARPRPYELAWCPVESALPSGPAERPAGTWLVYGADAEQCCAWQEELGAVVAVADSRLEGTADPRTRYVDLRDEADVERLLADLVPAGARLSGLILHGGPAVDGDGSEDALPDRAVATAQGLLLLLKHVLRRHAAAKPEILVCSTGAVALPEGGAPDLTQSPLTAAAKAVIAEYPELKCVQIDADPAARRLRPAEVLAHVAALPGSGHLAVRDARWYEARLRQHAQTASDHRPVRVRPDATYLVTGGFGGLGLATAGWLADQGARSLLLVGRTLPGADLPAVTELRARGVRVELRAADVTRSADVAELLARTAGLPPVRGIVHAAGVTSDAPLAELDGPAVERVMSPKVHGAWQLHRQTEGLELDFFVLYSSLVSLVGSAGQAGYIAGNAFLDALAEYRRRRDLPALSVSWGPWAEVGLAVRSGVLDQLAVAGVTGMPVAEALAAFGRLSADSPAHLGLATVDWRRNRAATAGRPYTLLADVAPQDLPENAAAGSEPIDELAQLVLRDRDRARGLLLDQLLDRVVGLLAMPAADRERLRPAFAATELGTLGLDSLTTIRLRNRLATDFGADVPPDVLLGGGTADEVVDLICRQLAIRAVLAPDEDGTDAEDTEVLTL
ncbi:type I polyketide synthase, partial [Kitasatospora sp. NPDC056531]|uniref:type I polyketide synthase n=1 Tax=Kitasatospora sp. NPDC056531 TaxID=3345856 RepID=UPI00368D6AB6